jgi:hypothetical protein
VTVRAPFSFCAAPFTRTLSTLMRRSILAVLALISAVVVRAWDYEGHRIVNELALDALPNDFPAFAKTPEARERIAFLAGEPDRWRNSTNQAFRHWHAPEHYIDIDELSNYGLTQAQLTPFRYDFAVLLGEGRAKHPEHFASIDPQKNSDHTRELIGFLPWSINDHFGQLESAFSYLKALEQAGTRDEIANARQNIIYIMGTMGHFIGDAAQPLHTTKHFNGWVGENPNRYRTNHTIHGWIDGGFIRATGIKHADLKSKVRPAHALWASSPTNAFGEALNFINAQAALVEKVYMMDRDGALTPRNAKSSEGKEFIGGQLVKGGQFLSDLWYSAWLHAPADKFLMGELKKRAAEKKAAAQ